MRIVCFMVLLLVAGPAAADESAVRVSAGYSFAQYLEEGGGDAPLGFYLSIASNARIGVEADIGYHATDVYLGPGAVARPAGGLSYGNLEFTHREVTAVVGPRIRGDYGRLQPYAHLLLGMSYEWIESRGSSANMVVALGTGFDIGTGMAPLLRLAADFQVFRNQDEFRVLRLSAGLAF